MASSESDDGQRLSKPPTLTLDTSSAASTPPSRHEALDAAQASDATTTLATGGSHAVTLNNLSLVDGRSLSFLSRKPSNSSTASGVNSTYSLANITPLPSPAGSISGSPSSRKGPSLHHIFNNVSSPPLRPERLSPGLSPTRLPALRHSPSGSSLQNHKRSRSRSDYVATGIAKPWQRIVVSGSQTPTMALDQPPTLQREEYMADKRGITTVNTPTAASTASAASEQDASHLSESTISYGTSDTSITDVSSDAAAAVPAAVPATTTTTTTTTTAAQTDRFEARSVRSGKLHSWLSIRELGTGTFSRVMLGAREPLQGPPIEDRLPRISLVAVKICGHGPAGGADQRKIEVSLKRELDILRGISHPSLINLKAVDVGELRTLLVLNYCPGGDLFEVASSRQGVLTAPFVQRVFAELVSAVAYLHDNWIVHRDIKLENVLVNVPPIELQQIGNYATYPHSIVTLTDLGLGRFIPKPPESPLLHTRCGSEDYAAPELLMGREYDGRSVDAWALGVLLYAMVEARLPFDPIPGARRQSPKTHRIARCDWTWVLRADDDLEWDPAKGAGFEGARECVDNLLTKARSRWPVAKLQQQDWVRAGIQVDGGLSQHSVL